MEFQLVIVSYFVLYTGFRFSNVFSVKIPFINRKKKKHFKGHIQKVEEEAQNYKWNTKEWYKPLSVRNAAAIIQVYE